MLTAVLIDQREPEWVRRLTFGGALVATTLCEHGDFQVACDDGNVLLIERKTPSDLLNSLADGRLLVQMAEMSQASIWSYLLITGAVTCGVDGKTQIDGVPTGWSFAAVQGALLSVQEMGCFVTWAASNSDLESAVVRLARRDRGRMPVAPARFPVLLSPGEAALAALPGIGPDRLDALMRHTQTPARALEFLTNTNGNDKVPGVGPHTKTGVRQALGLAEDQTLTITTRS